MDKVQKTINDDDKEKLQEVDIINDDDEVDEVDEVEEDDEDVDDVDDDDDDDDDDNEDDEDEDDEDINIEDDESKLNLDSENDSKKKNFNSKINSNFISGIELLDSSKKTHVNNSVDIDDDDGVRLGAQVADAVEANVQTG